MELLEDWWGSCEIQGPSSNEPHVPLDVYTAASIGNCASISQALELNPNSLNQCNKGGWTALMYAAYYGHLAAVMLLHSRGASVHTRTDRGYNALMMATMCDNAAVVSALIKCGSLLEVRDSKSWTTVFHAVYARHCNVLRLLLENGANANACEHQKGETPLLLACGAGAVEMVQLLLQHGADPAMPDYANTTPYAVAKRMELQHVADVIARAVATTGIAARMADGHAFEDQLNSSKQSRATLEQLLAGGGLGPEYFKLFEEEAVNLQVFLSLTDAELKECGVSKMGPRRRMTALIARWHSNAPVRCARENAYADKLELELQELSLKYTQAVKENKMLQKKLSQEEELRASTESLVVEARARLHQCHSGSLSLASTLVHLYSRVLNASDYSTISAGSIGVKDYSEANGKHCNTVQIFSANDSNTFAEVVGMKNCSDVNGKYNQETSCIGARDKHGHAAQVVSANDCGCSGAGSVGMKNCRGVKDNDGHIVKEISYIGVNSEYCRTSEKKIYNGAYCGGLVARNESREVEVKRYNGKLPMYKDGASDTEAVVKKIEGHSENKCSLVAGSHNIGVYLNGRDSDGKIFYKMEINSDCRTSLNKENSPSMVNTNKNATAPLNGHNDARNTYVDDRIKMNGVANLRNLKRQDSCGDTYESSSCQSSESTMKVSSSNAGSVSSIRTNNTALGNTSCDCGMVNASNEAIHFDLNEGLENSAVFEKLGNLLCLSKSDQHPNLILNENTKNDIQKNDQYDVLDSRTMITFNNGQRCHSYLTNVDNVTDFKLDDVDFNKLTNCFRTSCTLDKHCISTVHNNKYLTPCNKTSLTYCSNTSDKTTDDNTNAIANKHGKSKEYCSKPSQSNNKSVKGHNMYPQSSNNLNTENCYASQKINNNGCVEKAVCQTRRKTENNEEEHEQYKNNATAEARHSSKKSNNNGYIARLTSQTDRKGENSATDCENLNEQLENDKNNPAAESSHSFEKHNGCITTNVTQRESMCNANHSENDNKELKNNLKEPEISACNLKSKANNSDLVEMLTDIRLLNLNEVMVPSNYKLRPPSLNVPVLGGPLKDCLRQLQELVKLTDPNLPRVKSSSPSAKKC